jgi:undecaprenyl-diphosphatase
MVGQLFAVVLLGIVEGLTEFIPVSSTGHLILVGSLINFQSDFGTLFEIVIQLGAILAVCLYSAPKLLSVVRALPFDPKARRFVVALCVAFLPSAVIGLALHGFIKSVLFSWTVVTASLVIGGIVILIIERWAPQPRYDRIEEMPLRVALAIGMLQVLSMIPGVSRAGATILGGVTVGVDRRTSTQFSFFLAIPTMLGATIVDLWKTPVILDHQALMLISVGFATAFVVALVVVRWFVAFVGHHGFSIFGWYRIAVGVAMALLLLARG